MDQYTINIGNEILGGGGGGNANYADLTYRPNGVSVSPPIYSDFNALYTAIQTNTSNSVITRLWLDDSLTQMIIPAGSGPWDF